MDYYEQPTQKTNLSKKRKKNVKKEEKKRWILKIYDLLWVRPKPCSKSILEEKGVFYVIFLKFILPRQ